MKDNDGGGSGAIDSEVLDACLNIKADKSEIFTMRDMKSNKQDTEITLSAVEIIHKQVKSTIVLIVEMIKGMIRNPNDSDNMIKNK